MRYSLHSKNREEKIYVLFSYTFSFSCNTNDSLS